MSAKARSKAKTKVKQWHSWRPAWLTTTAILVFILVGAVGLLLTSMNPTAVSGVFSLDNAKADGPVSPGPNTQPATAGVNFHCSVLTLKKPTTAKGYVLAPLSVKCNDDYFIELFVVAYGKSGKLLSSSCSPDGPYPGCGLTIPPLSYNYPPPSYYLAGTAHSSIRRFNVTHVDGHATTGPCRYHWQSIMFVVQKISGTYYRIESPHKSDITC